MLIQCAEIRLSFCTWHIFFVCLFFYGQVGCFVNVQFSKSKESNMIIISGI